MATSKVEKEETTAIKLNPSGRDLRGDLSKFKPHTLKVATPVATLNLSNPGPDGKGGISFSGLVEVFGASRSGKSTLVYQTASYFLEDFKDKARLLIMSVEGYPNTMRLLMAFKLDIENDSRITVECTTTIEDSNDAIQRHAKKCREEGTFLFIIWDSISASSFNRAKEAIDESLKTEDGKQSERGMTEPMARAQILKWCLNNTLHAIYRQPIIVFLINQITTKMNQFNTSVDSSGGYALRHNVEERIQVDFVKHIGGDGKGDLYKTGTLSRVTVVKSRNIPGFQDIPIRINDQDGGIIEEFYEIPLVASQLGVLSMKSGGWYQVAEEWLPENPPEEYKKAKQLKDIWPDKGYQDFLRQAITKYIRSQFKLVNFSYEYVFNNNEALRAQNEQTRPNK